MTLYLIPDTNFFLHFKDYDQLPWANLFPQYKNFIVMIPMQVVNELDNHKTASGRKAKRARHIHSIIANLLFTDIIKSSKGNLTISLTLMSTKTKTLDSFPKVGDDVIIEQTKLWVEENSNKEYCFISHDNGILFKCKEIGIKFISSQTFDENWLLQPEPDTNQKKIKELENKITLLEEQKPNIEIEYDKKTQIPLEFFDGFKTDEERNTFKMRLKETFPIKEVKPISIEEMTKKLKPSLLVEKSLEKSAFGSINKTITTGITQEEIDEYRKKYIEWLSLVSFETSILKVYQPFHMGSFSFTITNKGKFPAKKLQICIKNSNGFIFDPYDEEDILSIKNLLKFAERRHFPAPPFPPMGFYHLIASSLLPNVKFDNALLKIPRIPHDKKDNQFYIIGERQNHLTKQIHYDCPNFFHKKEKEFTFHYVIPSHYQEKNIVIDIEVIAENIPEAITESMILDLDRSTKIGQVAFLEHQIETIKQNIADQKAEFLSPKNKRK